MNAHDASDTNTPDWGQQLLRRCAATTQQEQSEQMSEHPLTLH